MAAVVTILDHVMPKIDRCAILKPLEYPEAKSEANAETSYFPDPRWLPWWPSWISAFRKWRDVGLSMTHVKFQGERTSTFRVIKQIRFWTRWPSWRPSWITWCQKSIVVQYWSLWSTLKAKAKQILKLHIFRIQDGRCGGHLGSEHSEKE